MAVFTEIFNQINVFSCPTSNGSERFHYSEEQITEQFWTCVASASDTTSACVAMPTEEAPFVQALEGGAPLDDDGVEIVTSCGCSPCSTPPCHADDRGNLEDADEEWLANLELLDDVEELAHFLANSAYAVHENPRLEALFERAASGNGYYSQLIRAAGMI